VSTHTFVREGEYPYSAATVFDWYSRPGAFERLNAPWRPVSIVHSSGGIEDGSEVLIKVPVIGPFSIPWRLRHRDFVAGVQFVDEQVTGPFKSWRHIHKVIAINERSCRFRDEITFELPPLFSLGKGFLLRDLDRLFRYRHNVLGADLALHSRWAEQPRKSILVSGSSGFVGSALTTFLTTAGDTVIRLVRRAPKSPQERYWDPQQRLLDPSVFDGIDVVIHLGGEDISRGRWTAEKKSRIRESRVLSTTLLSQTIAKLTKPPGVVIMASAVGYYGDTGNKVVDESSTRGKGFLSDTSEAWEGASQVLLDAPLRLVNLRIGTVLSPRGGALKKMIPPFLAFVGGPLGSGAQYMSWIALQDLLGIFEHAIYSSTLRGPVNAVSPRAVTNSEFTKALARALHRPALLRAPAAALRAILGEMADALLLASSRVMPLQLIKDGYQFLYPELDAALRGELG